MDIANIALDAGYAGIKGAVGGLIYGALFKADIKTAIVACAISGVVWHLFVAITQEATGGWEAKPILTGASMVTGTLVIGTIQIAAFRHLGLIGTPGTVWFSTVTALCSVIYLSIAYIQTHKASFAP